MNKKIGLSMFALWTILLGLVWVAVPDGQQSVISPTRIHLGGNCMLRTGTGSPEGSVTGNVCDTYFRSNGSGGTVIYVKESGTGNTGWTPVQTDRWGGYVSSTALTDAQIKTLPTTPVTILGATTSGFSIVPEFIVITSNFTAGAYTNIDAAGYLYIERSNTTLWSTYLANDAAESKSALTAFMGQALKQLVVLREWSDTATPSAGWGTLPGVFDLGDGESLRITISNGSSGNLTGGNSANSMIITTYFMVIPIP